MTTAADLANGYPRAGWAKARAQGIVDAFHRLFYDTERHAQARWFGHEVWKYPTDLVVYAELVHQLRPALIIECGTYLGGSALYFAHLCELAGHGRVLTIDVKAWSDSLPTHPRLRYLVHPGGSTDPDVVAQARDAAERDGGPVLVVLDSDHTCGHVLAELEAYHPLVTPGSYLVVEDTNLGGRPVLPGWGPGPAEALAAWLPHHPEFVARRDLERLLLTANPGGWLQRQ